LNFFQLYFLKGILTLGKDELHYDNTHITFLEKLWGDGYMSPGGKKEIEKL